jgi:hypothetical protein
MTRRRGRSLQPSRRVALAAITVIAAMARAGQAPLPDRILLDGFEPPDLADIRPLSDEFADAATFGNWRRIWRDEYWLRDPLEQFDIGTTLDGWITLVPYTSTWYEDYVGTLAFQRISGDFVATARVRARARAGTGAPGSTHGGPAGSEYSLAGVMVRAPQANVACCDSSWWQAGGERYVFLSLGSADQTGAWQFEVKTTRAATGTEAHSVSILQTSVAQGDEAELRIARIGPSVLVLLREPDSDWRVHQRYRRDDFPLELQVGMTVYTDWAIASTYPYREQNTTRIEHGYLDPGTPADPDLRAQFDYLRFVRPQVPPELAGLDLTDPQQVSDAQLLAFLGDSIRGRAARPG